MKDNVVILCEFCEHANCCKILNPYRCHDKFSLALSSNFNSEILLEVAKRLELVDSNYSS